jgi:hypothetical protein
MTFSCLRCDHTWTSKITMEDGGPDKCPNCSTHHWDKPRGITDIGPIKAVGPLTMLRMLERNTTMDTKCRWKHYNRKFFNGCGGKQGFTRAAKRLGIDVQIRCQEGILHIVRHE